MDCKTGANDADPTWCTFVLLLILFSVLNALLVLGTYAAMNYYKRIGSELDDEEKHLSRQHYPGPGLVAARASVDRLDDSSVDRPRHPFRPDNTAHAALSDSFNLDTSSSDQQPHMLLPAPKQPDAQPYSGPGYPYSALTLEQQYALAQYWQAVYNHQVRQAEELERARMATDSTSD